MDAHIAKRLRKQRDKSKLKYEKRKARTKRKSLLKALRRVKQILKRKE